MPFGMGERSCPGCGFARREIITVVRRLQIDMILNSKKSSRILDCRTLFMELGASDQGAKYPFEFVHNLGVSVSRRLIV